VDYPLDGGPGKPEKKPAVTEFAVLARAEIAQPDARHESSRYALVRCTPLTGRYRQIRRHLKHLSHHLAGDSSHGDGRPLEARAPLDAEFLRALAFLGIAWPLAD
jgi:tRNA pseudouridine65 synthase